VVLRQGRIESVSHIAALVEDFHATHRQIFEVCDPQSGIELVTWRARVRCKLQHGGKRRLATKAGLPKSIAGRRAYFLETGWVDAKVARSETLEVGADIAGPAIVESSFTTIVVDPSAIATPTNAGGLVIRYEGTAA
jgi:N-methylhydantoinase A